MGIVHNKVATLPDEAGAEVNKNEWNEDHVITGDVNFGGFAILNATISSALVTGLGTMAVQNANAVAITGGTVNGLTSLSVTAGVLTTDVKPFSQTLTWNNAAVAFTAWDMVITDAASHASSLAMRIRGGVAGATEFIAVDKSGNVGIGTTSPSGRLAVTGPDTTTGRAFVVADSNNLERFTVLDNGSATFNTTGTVQLGSTTGQNALFNFVGSSFLSLRYATMNRISLTNDPADFGAGYVGHAGIKLLGTNDSSFSTITSGATNELILNQTGGNVGIGTTSPGELLSLGLAGTTAGVLSLAGLTSGKAIIVVPAVAGTPTLTLPTTTGTFALVGEAAAAVAAHEGAADPHTGYQKESEKGAASGYAGLGVGGFVPATQLGSGVADATTVLFGDQVYRAPGAASVPDIPLSLLAPAVDETITAGYSAYLSDYYEIADGKMLEISGGSVFEIG